MNNHEDNNYLITMIIFCRIMNNTVVVKCGGHHYNES